MIERKKKIPKPKLPRKRRSDAGIKKTAIDLVNFPTFRVEPGILNQFNELADRRAMKRSDLIREVLDRFLKSST